MKYNIFDFNQEKVISLSKKIIDNGKDRIISLDVSDLLILLVISDFVNRKNIIKYTINDKTYFSVQYKIILDDLPILNIKKQALTDRINKMVYLGVIEKEIIKNQTGSYSVFRMGEEYEKIKYSCTDTQLQVQQYSTTSAEVVDYKPKDTSTNNYSTNNKESTNVDKKDEIDFDLVLSKWSEYCPMLSKPRMIDNKRKKMIISLLKNNEATIDDMFKCFKIMANSQVCNGDGGTWKASFDWFIKNTNSCFNGLLEGKYSFKGNDNVKYKKIMDGEDMNTDNTTTENNVIEINGKIYK